MKGVQGKGEELGSLFFLALNDRMWTGWLLAMMNHVVKVWEHWVKTKWRS